MRAVRDLDYVANAHARALAGVGARPIAFVLDDITYAAFSHIVSGVEAEAANRGRFCLVCTTHGDPDRELAAVNLMREQHAEAVILVGGAFETPIYRSRMADIARSLDSAGSCLVLCGRPPLGSDVPAIMVDYDNEGGAFAITCQLLERGHRQVLFLTGRPGHSASEGRVAGFRRALASFGLSDDPELTLPGTLTGTSGYQRTQAAISSGLRFSAIFAASDEVAVGALHALREHGLSVPGDVSLVGFDDIPMAAEISPSLTTVHVPQEELGRTAVRMVLDRPAESPVYARTTLGTHVVIRDSVGPVPPSFDGRSTASRL